MKERKNTCINCKYFDLLDQDEVGHWILGICRRYPPFGAGRSNANYTTPNCPKYDWCGEWSMSDDVCPYCSCRLFTTDKFCSQCGAPANKKE